MAALAVGGVLGGCAGEPAAPTPIVLALPTIAANGACAGVGLVAVLHGKPDDPRIAWVTSLPEGQRIETVWARGDVAVFDPTLAILDASGRIVIREGDYVDGGCVTGPDANGPLLILNPDDSFRLDCGPVRPFDCSAMLNALRFGSRDWPKARIATISFSDPAGHYTIVFEDGRRFDGLAPPVV